MNFSKTGLIILVLLISCGKSKLAKSEPGVKKIVGEEVTYSADNIQMKGFLAFDASISGKRPGVLVVHEWWGHNDYTRNRANMLAEMGYIALAVDMYGDGKIAAHPEDAGEFASAVFKNFEGAKIRFDKAFDVLRSNPNADGDNIAAIGYCFGGGIVLNMARQGKDLKGVVSFHGGLGPVSPAKEGTLKGRILVCNGAADKFTSEKEIADFKKEMDAAKANYSFKSYEGAVHGFTNPGADSLGQKFKMALAYNAPADQQSWSDMTAFFKEIFGK